ncbi:MAG: cell division protein ZapB [Treponema sp.]
MVTLDQISQLETKVEKAIQLIQSLKTENDSLRLEIHDKDNRIAELENLILVFKNDQIKIEEGIINALNHLSAFEDTIYQTKSDVTDSPAEAAPLEQTTPEQEKPEEPSNTDASWYDEGEKTSSDTAEQMEIF